VEDVECHIYWNYTFPTARHLSTTKPDIIPLDLRVKTITLIEFSCPAELNMGRKKVRKKEKYQDLMGT
jgi:hypothetical protein